jgi:transcriptional regulator with XRE-family HTH domain
LNTMGSWIRTMRERHNLKQEELLEAFKREYKPVAKSTLSAWETETANPPIHDNAFVEAVARIFNVTEAEVLKGSGYNLGQAYESELDEGRRLLLEAYDNGDLERLVAMALEAHRQRVGYSRLASNDTTDDESTGSATTASRQR